MVRVQIGNLFDSQAQTWVNTVNCVGVMGKGIALEFKKRFPEMFDDYAARCRRHEVRLGHPYLYKCLVPPWILNFPTKDHWRSVAKLESITRGLEHLLQHYRQWGITSLAVPPLGCGEGQLEWRIVGRILYRYLERMDIPVEVYAPYGTPQGELEPEFYKGARTGSATAGTRMRPRRVQPGWVALVEILARLEAQPYHWPTGRTLFQKIAYVATEEGLPTNLSYRRGSYGPFAPELKGVITRLVNNGLICEERLGSMFAVRVGPTFADARRAYADELQQWDSTIERIADLFLRMNTRQAEIAATVLFAARSLERARSSLPTEWDVLAAVMEWKQRRKPQLYEGSVAETIRNLAALGWLRVRASADLPLPSDESLYA